MSSVAATDENSTTWKLRDASAVVFVCTRQHHGRPAVQYSFHVVAGMQTVMLPPNVATFIFSDDQEPGEDSSFTCNVLAAEEGKLFISCLTFRQPAAARGQRRGAPNEEAGLVGLALLSSSPDALQARSYLEHVVRLYLADFKASASVPVRPRQGTLNVGQGHPRRESPRSALRSERWARGSSPLIWATDEGTERLRERVERTDVFSRRSSETRGSSASELRNSEARRSTNSELGRSSSASMWSEQSDGEDDENGDGGSDGNGGQCSNGGHFNYDGQCHNGGDGHYGRNSSSGDCGGGGDGGSRVSGDGGSRVSGGGEGGGNVENGGFVKETRRRTWTLRVRRSQRRWRGRSSADLSGSCASLTNSPRSGRASGTGAFCEWMAASCAARRWDLMLPFLDACGEGACNGLCAGLDDADCAGHEGGAALLRSLFPSSLSSSSPRLGRQQSSVSSVSTPSCNALSRMSSQAPSHTPSNTSSHTLSHTPSGTPHRSNWRAQPGPHPDIDHSAPAQTREDAHERWRATAAARLLRICGAEVLATLLSALLQERSVLLLAPDHEWLVCAAEGLCACLAPLSWQGAYLPVLPTSLHELLHSPVPFVFGLRIGGEGYETDNAAGGEAGVEGGGGNGPQSGDGAGGGAAAGAGCETGEDGGGVGGGRVGDGGDGDGDDSKIAILTTAIGGSQDCAASYGKVRSSGVSRNRDVRGNSGGDSRGDGSRADGSRCEKISSGGGRVSEASSYTSGGGGDGAAATMRASVAIGKPTAEWRLAVKELLQTFEFEAPDALVCDLPSRKVVMYPTPQPQPLPPRMHKSLVRALMKLLSAPGSFPKRHHARDSDCADGQKDSRMSASEIFRDSVPESPRGSLMKSSGESSWDAEQEPSSEPSRTSTRRDLFIRLMNLPQHQAGNQPGEQPGNLPGFVSWPSFALDERVLGAAVLRECGKVVGTLCDKALAAVEEERRCEKERETEMKRKREEMEREAETERLWETENEGKKEMEKELEGGVDAENGLHVEVERSAPSSVRACENSDAQHADGDDDSPGHQHQQQEAPQRSPRGQWRLQEPEAEATLSLGVSKVSELERADARASNSEFSRPPETPPSAKSRRSSACTTPCGGGGGDGGGGGGGIGDFVDALKLSLLRLSPAWEGHQTNFVDLMCRSQQLSMLQALAHSDSSAVGSELAPGKSQTPDSELAGNGEVEPKPELGAARRSCRERKGEKQAVSNGASAQAFGGIFSRIVAQEQAEQIAPPPPPLSSNASPSAVEIASALASDKIKTHSSEYSMDLAPEHAKSRAALLDAPTLDGFRAPCAFAKDGQDPELAVQFGIHLRNMLCLLIEEAASGLIALEQYHAWLCCGAEAPDMCPAHLSTLRMLAQQLEEDFSDANDANAFDPVLDNLSAMRATIEELALSV